MSTMNGTIEKRLRGIAVEPNPFRTPCLGRTVREQAHVALEKWAEAWGTADHREMFCVGEETVREYM